MNIEPEKSIDLLEALTNADESLEAANLPALTAFERCEAPDCAAQAYVRARLESGLDLVFCGHHGHALMPALARQGAVIRDDTQLIVRDRRLG